MRFSASRATWRGSATAQLLAGLGAGAVAPRGGVLRALALGLDGDELEGAVAGADEEAVDRAGGGSVGDGPGPEHLEPLAAEGRPRPAEPHDTVQLDRRARPVELVLGGVEL